MPLAVLSVVAAGSAQAQAVYPCSASTAGLISRSGGGTCADGLTLNEEITLSYRFTNQSIVDNPGGPLDGTFVSARVPAGSEVVATLALETAEDGAMLSVLQFIPVCPVGSIGGTLAPGDPCDPLNDQCGSGTCGCVDSVPGVECLQSADPNKVNFDITQEILCSPDTGKTLATIRVRVIEHVPPPALCGLFFTRVDSNGDVIVTDDPLCETQVTAGCHASADLEAPECTVDSDCGDPQCNECVDVGINSHCAPRAANTACGVDEEPGDCLLPGCVIDTQNVGVCTQAVVDAPQDTSCSLENGLPVPTVECQTPQCNAIGNCVNVADTSQNGNACGTDENLTDCVTPACLDGACEQGQIDLPAGETCTNNGGVPVGAVQCETPECNATGLCVNVADPTQNGNPCGTDQNKEDCLAPACLDGDCLQEQINVPGGTVCNDDLFCTSGDVCTAEGICTGSLIDCSDDIECTEDTCDEDLNKCLHTPNDALCDDGDPCTTDTCSDTEGCLHEPDPSCQAICRSPGYWQTHSGTEKGAINVAQLLINATGPLHVCGQTITSTSNALGSLSSDLEALCVRVQGVQQRQLYRQLVAAALNCAVSAMDCDTLTGGAFDQCNTLCEGDPAGPLTVSQCISALDCFNNGGQMVDGKCATGTCAHDTDIACGSDSGACPLYNGQPQACVPFENSCHDQPMCNEAIGFCPGDTKAGSSNACNEANKNGCTIDSCQ